ncbi:GNAT family N-acetyltransferase [Mucilaginibacter ginkgonis]|uniref:GNAT family N-acetyltransferase n=1 Tax=Mucilaginibacter ginkgonis TaxID=2682091 RepID=A0A6I4I2L8_9SPHI|nr:GNAT family N-acetyltransferase [Mucilaginibacter ginkgonis]QQL49479.1 GNAT family N-acetyltransferase [Mucilaginibacter ginkgonis]
MNLDCSQQYILEDERVLLRPLEWEDIEHLRHFVVEEPEIWRFSLMAINSVDDLTEYVNIAVQNRAKGLEYPFIVFDKATQQYAGCTRFYDIQNIHSTLQLGYTWYGKNFQGSGLNKHCKYLLLQFAFETLGAERLELRADSKNDRSIAAMKSIGCTVEGILRSHMLKPDGSRRNSIVLSILKDEWISRIKALLQTRL